MGGRRLGEVPDFNSWCIRIGCYGSGGIRVVRRLFVFSRRGALSGVERKEDLWLYEVCVLLEAFGNLPDELAASTGP